jgi:hypothetical protein
MPTFVTPTQEQGVRRGDALFDRYTIPVGVSVVKRAGVYTETPFPWLGEIADLIEGTDYFLGGRTYTVTDAVAAALQADGFTVS